MNIPIGDRLFKDNGRTTCVAKFRKNRPGVEKSVDGKIKKLECGSMPNVMAALPNIGGALCSNFNATKFGARLGRKVNFVPGKIPLPGKNRRKSISGI